MSNLLENASLRNLVALAKQRWIIARDYQEALVRIRHPTDHPPRKFQKHQGPDC
jgi:hypothetical protein